MIPFHFCGVPESVLHAAAASLAQWPFKRLTWTVTDPLPGLTNDEWQEAYRLAVSYWSEVCGLEFAYTQNARTANILATAGRIDGPSGTLAWSELPAGTSRQLTQKYDTGEQRWVVSTNPRGGELDIVRVVCHEVGHAIGLPHISAGNLLAPTYSTSVRRPQGGDIAEAVRRYGKRVTPAPIPTPVPVPTPVPTPAPSPVPIPIPGGSTLNNFLVQMLLTMLKGQLEKWLADGTLQRVLEDLLRRLIDNKPQTVEALTAEATESMKLA